MSADLDHAFVVNEQDPESKEVTKSLLGVEESNKPKLSNFTILLLTTLLFGAFCIAEVIGALVSSVLN